MLDPTVAAAINYYSQQIQAEIQIRETALVGLLPQLSPQQQQTALGYEVRLEQLESYFFSTLLPEIITLISS